MTTKELLALVEKASELPWEAYPSEVWSVGNNREVAHRPDFNTTPNGYGQWEANAALIVAAVNALPALCAEVEAQNERIAQQDATIARLRGALGFFMAAAYPVCTTVNHRGHNWSEAYLDQAFVHARITMEGRPSSRSMAAELMRSVLPDECEYRGPNSGSTAGEVRGYNKCREETIARIEAWQNQGAREMTANKTDERYSREIIAALKKLGAE